MKKYTIHLAAMSLLIPVHMLFAQAVKYNTGQGVGISSVENESGQSSRLKNIPLFSMEIDGQYILSSEGKTSMIAGETLVRLNKDIMFKFNITAPMQARLIFRNTGKDTLTLENVVPFGADPEHVYITGEGPWSLTRAKLYRPGYGTVNVILPDNAWELGYGSFETADGQSLAGLCRRTTLEGGQKHRYKTSLYPGGEITYEFHFEIFGGEWQNGLKKIFHDNYLYDLESFDNTLFERDDLEWIREAYIIGLNFAWDREYYDRTHGIYTLREYIDDSEELFGGYDVYSLWPTWPRLGLDERNQFDLFRDLPGGLPALHQLTENLHREGIRFFICFNPWDESTRKEDPYKGMAAIIDATDADGVVLDCSGNSNERLQTIADSIKPGVIMYSEGMAVTKDMPGIVAGRVHNAIYYSPPLNLNKLIKPEFAIFRVLENKDADLRRELVISFFNGYGNELNSMAAGRPAELRKDLEFLGKTTFILRQNSGNFLSTAWTPLMPAVRDSIWVNAWPGREKTIYTVLSFVAEGHDGPLFEAAKSEGVHYVSLWHHEDLIPVKLDGKYYLPARLSPYDKNYRNTRKEGSVDCIAAFPVLLKLDTHGPAVSASMGNRIVVWRSNPSYSSEYREYTLVDGSVNIDPGFIAGELKICIQLFEGKDLIDELIYKPIPGKPWLVSQQQYAKYQDMKGMEYIEGGSYDYVTEHTDEFIPYPGPTEAVDTLVHDFYIDEKPVSNRDYYQFMQATGYVPDDTTNFLKHWTGNKYPEELADAPVVHITCEDAAAYALWAGKRIPTEMEWQYAMQQHELGYGTVWEMTNDLYDNGSHSFIIIKGGSYFKPEASWWYIQGGKQTPQRQQMLLLVGPGFDRSSTVGFRCVADKLKAIVIR